MFAIRIPVKKLIKCIENGQNLEKRKFLSKKNLVHCQILPSFQKTAKHSKTRQTNIDPFLFTHRYSGWSRQPCFLLRCYRKWHGCSNRFMGFIFTRMELNCFTQHIQIKTKFSNEIHTSNI